MGKLKKLTEEDRAWLCSCSSYAKVKKPELVVMATSNVEIMLHNLRCEIEELKAALKPFADYFEGDLKGVGGGTAIAPEMTMQPFKNAKELLAETE